ncbi:unnamed protein product [Rhizophagus irregularis]|nr:unnamed protein product [Rhizophagus irregularis]
MEKPSFIISKLGSDVPKNGKIPRFVWVDFHVLKNGKIPKIRSGRLPKKGKPRNQDSFRWASEERKPKDKDSCGGLPTNKNPKIKIRFGFGWIGFDFGLWAFDSIGCDILGL